MEATTAVDRRVRPWLVAVAVVATAAALLGLGARATYGARTTADEPQYLLTAQSLGDDLDLNIADELAEAAYLSYHELPVDRQTTVLDDGRELSPHDPLLPALLAAPMAAGGWVAAKATLAVLAGATAALATWIAIRRFAVTPPVAALAIGAAFVGVPLAPYGTQIYPELPAALAVLVGLAAVTRVTPSRTATVAGLAAIVALPWLAVKYVPIAAVLAVALVIGLHRAGVRRWPALGTLALSAVLYLALHRLWYGGWTVYAAGDHFRSSGEFSAVGTDIDLTGRSRRLVGLLADREFGIGVWNPVWLVAPFAAGVLVARRPPGWVLLAALVAVGWLNATFVALTMHGWWVPGRQVVVVAPVLAIAIAIAAERHRPIRPVLAVSGAIATVSWAWVAIESSTGRRTLVVDAMDTGAWTYRVLRPLFPSGLRAAPADTAVLVSWAAVAVAAMFVGWTRSRPSAPVDATAGTPPGTMVGWTPPDRSPST